MKIKLTCTIIILLIVSTIISFNGIVYEKNQIASFSSNENKIDFTNPMTINQYSNGESVLIIVDSTLWISSAIKTAVQQYRLDLNNTGYHTILVTNPITNATYLKQIIQGYYYSDQISGAILIGPLPYARFYHPASTNFAAETFICDLFFTDLDGTWMDGPTPDGIYDTHLGPPGDIYPEIYLGRIDATNRTLGGLTNEQNILSVLNRLHSYRTGGVARTHQALTYIDDDWQLWADGTYDNWPGWLQNPYPTRTDIHTPATYTNATDWLNRITQDYEWTHLCVHSGSSPSQHYFGPGGIGEGTVTAAQIHSAQPSFNFYNLYCCKGADWTKSDCLATTYLYSSSYSIGVVATTKTGGMFYGNNFYPHLAQNETIGKSLYYWFQGITSYSASEYLEWFYGMVILGDPFLTIHYDCTVYSPDVSSTTHPNPYQWYSNALPEFNWSVPIDVNGIAGYYYILDHNPTAIPDLNTWTFTTINGTKVSSALAEGTWYFHVVTKDGAGNIGKTATHYQILVDYNNPSISILSPIVDTSYDPGQIDITWSATDAGSGCNYIEIYINDIYDGSVVHPTNSYMYNFTVNGYYNITVKVYDMLGNTDTDRVQIRVYSFLQSLEYKILLYSGIGVAALTVILCPIVIIARKRKR